MRIRSAFVVTLLCGAVGCMSREQRTSAEESASKSRSPASSSSVIRGETTSVCFHLPQSVLARTPAGPSVGPKDLTGWVALDGRAGERAEGTGRLVDSDGQGMQARWNRADTLTTVLAADDFLRVELRFSEASDSIRGYAEASSDAALERDSTGVLQAFRRTWKFSGRRRECTELPAPRTDASAP